MDEKMGLEQTVGTQNQIRYLIFYIYYFSEC